MKALGIAVVVMLALTGCATDRLPEPDYFNLVRETPGLADLDDYSLKDIGVNICGVFREAPAPYVTALKVLIDGGYEAGDSGALITFSVQQYCPEELDQIPGI